MTFILFVAAPVLIYLIFFFLSTRNVKNVTQRGNGGIFSPAWNRIDGHNLNKKQHSSKRYNGVEDADFITDKIFRATKSRRVYYREVYLHSAAWKRKRFVVLRRDHWTCVYCNKPATQVHHQKYARQIGKEPISWLVSVCEPCHIQIHH